MITIRARLSAKGLQLMDPLPALPRCDALVTFLEPGLFGRTKRESPHAKIAASRLKLIRSARGAFKSKSCSTKTFMRIKAQEKALEG